MASMFHDTKGSVDLEGLLREVVESDKNAVAILISDVNGEEKYPDRIITLQYPDWSVNIGRGNSTEEALMPSPTNAWFTSRVMSRHHATLKAYPEERYLTVSDAGSMHGTYLNGEKVMLGQPEQLLKDDIITFGNQVVRGHEAFPPLKVSLHFEWTEPGPVPNYKPFSNSFTADYSEEDIPSDVSDDDEVEFIEESIEQPRVEVIELDGGDRTFSVLTSPSTSSGRRRPSSESDPTSTSIAGLGNDEEKDFLFEEDEFPEQARQTREASLDSDDHNPSTDEEVGMEERLNGVEATEQNLSETFGALKVPGSTCTTTARDPSPSDAAMAKPRPASPAILASLAPPPPPAPKSRDPPTSFDASGSTYFLNGYANPWRQTINMSQEPSVLEPFSNSCAGTFGYSVSPDAYSYPYARPSYPISPSQATQTSLPRVPDLPSCSMPWPSTQYTFYPVNGRDGLATCARKRKADEMSDYSEWECSDDDEADSEMDSMDETPPEPLSPEIPPSTNGSHLGLAFEASSPTWTPESPTMTRVPAPVADPEPEPGLTADKYTAFTTTSQADDESIAVIEEAAGAAAAQLAVEALEGFPVRESPRKKIKIGENITAHRTIKGSGTSRQVIKYAATALAGATVGAIGAVIGLAALPPDFFA